MSDPAEMIQWLDRRIASAMTWLKDHGHGSKKPRPENEISTKLYDVARFEEIKAAYLKALAKRDAA
ncbi:hypothetical protein M2267_003056 [Ensifer sp. KUDG1]|uniref:hypothetical protein n=1 Tax=Ensifer sp. KUDG1 TaxID=3373919 RepID=UPI003D1EC6E1